MPASKYTPFLHRTICRRLSTGETLVDICDDIGVDDDTVRAWEKRIDGLSDDLARARARGEEKIGSDLRRVARGEEGFSSGDVQRDRTIIDTDLKLLAVWNPRKYGQKQQVELSGGLTLKVGDATDEELVMMMLDLQATGRFKPPNGAQLEEGETDEQADDDFSDLAPEDDFSDIA
ncbi:hypothetical protein UFOVP1324_18 [uncultured Caudovirales phage]|uniref:Terminase small subunit n=1 Tax=uncultured Caudovirales phage TaxID=2100421 RepID=A0A6J5RYC9_9CAUD|nr:hypothetical protein UFOVP1324_18 [uncultured Caudovirales phage]